MKHYLDYNATAPLRPEVQAVMQALQALPLNASSVHAMGRKAKAAIEDSRRAIGEALGVFANEVVFTASGTEANNWALCAFADHRLFVSSIEHSSVLKAAQGRGHTLIPVTTDGVVDMVMLEKLLSHSPLSRMRERDGVRADTKWKGNKLLIENARKLRKQGTDVEKILWSCLRDSQLAGFKFRRQHPVQHYVVDFACIETGLIVELDGGQHNEDVAIIKDKMRTAFLEKHDFKVMRFWNNDILENLDGVLETILTALQDMEALKSPHPNPLPLTGEGIGESFLVSVMLANNETGAIQPIADIAKLVHARGGLLHCDAVQGLGKIPVDFTVLGCDLMTVSAHKMGGPVGAAALIVRNNLPVKPMLVGGGQELGRRAGTENVAAIAGFAKAVELIDLNQMQRLKDWHTELESDLQASAPIAGFKVTRLPNVSCIAMPGVPAETQLISLDLVGIAVSAGSACSSGRIEASHVLKAMGVEDNLAASFIRISSGWNSKKEDFTALKNAWQKLYHLKNPQNLRQA